MKYIHFKNSASADYVQINFALNYRQIFIVYSRYKNWPRLFGHSVYEYTDNSSFKRLTEKARTDSKQIDPFYRASQPSISGNGI